MSVISGKNKIQIINFKDHQQPWHVDKIKKINFDYIYCHHLCKLNKYQIIERTCITTQTNYYLFEIFKFTSLIDSIVPFIVFTPIIGTNSFIDLSDSAQITFIHNWLKRGDVWYLYLGIYGYSLNDEDKLIQLYGTVNMHIKSLHIVRKLYFSKR